MLVAIVRKTEVTTAKNNERKIKNAVMTYRATIGQLMFFFGLKLLYYINNYLFICYYYKFLPIKEY